MTTEPTPENLRDQLRQSRDETGALRAERNDLQRQLRTSRSQVERMSSLLESTQGKIEELKTALEADGQPPLMFATVTRYHPQRTHQAGREIEAAAGHGCDVLSNGRKMRVSVSPLIEGEHLRPGTDVLLNENHTIIAVTTPEGTGEIARVKEVLDSERIVVLVRNEDERVVRLQLPPEQAEAIVRAGDAVIVDLRSATAIEVISLFEVEDVVLEESPSVGYEDIGGLGEQIEQIRDAVELPFQRADLYREHGLRAPKGILLYGPPGCGKTLIAKAVAASLSRADGADTGESSPGGGGAYFLNIKGPELLNKFVGETERHIRVIFSRARERASEGSPVVVFFDEMEALFRTRGAGVSSDVETTIVPQLLAEIDGVETLDNVIVIGASNREDMIDPAILRPGRLDVKIRVQRPDAVGAAQILGIHMSETVPISGALVGRMGSSGAARQRLIDVVVAGLYRSTTATSEGDERHEGRELFPAEDFVSGAVLSNIVDRAKKAAIKSYLAADEAPEAKGITISHMEHAVTEEIADQLDMLATADPQHWHRIQNTAKARIQENL